MFSILLASTSSSRYQLCVSRTSLMMCPALFSAYARKKERGAKIHYCLIKQENATLEQYKSSWYEQKIHCALKMYLCSSLSSSSSPPSWNHRLRHHRHVPNYCQGHSLSSITIIAIMNNKNNHNNNNNNNNNTILSRTTYLLRIYWAGSYPSNKKNSPGTSWPRNGPGSRIM